MISTKFFAFENLFAYFFAIVLHNYLFIVLRKHLLKHFLLSDLIITKFIDDVRKIVI